MRLRLSITALSLLVGVWVWCPYSVGVVRGGSMEPALRSGQLFMLDRSYYRGHPVAKGDVVVFRLGRQVYVKRVSALAGETVLELRSSDAPSLVINPAWRRRMERSIGSRHGDGLGQLVAVHVPRGCVYVLGDEFGASVDSRQFGPVRTACILGRVRTDEGRSRQAAAAADPMPGGQAASARAAAVL